MDEKTIDGTEPERNEAGTAFRTSFRIRAITDADPAEEPYLDKVIDAADADYRHDVISGGDRARTDWRNAAAYEWRRLMLEPHGPSDPATDPSALAVIAVGMRYAPDAVRAMIATDVLSPDLPTMRELRDIIATPDRDAVLERDHAAWRILSPIHLNAPAPVEGHIEGLLAMLDHVEHLDSTVGMGREHAERALRFDPFDRFAAATLDAAPDANGVTGLSELSDATDDRGMAR
ncbi:hypothetical protein [Bifidobacterium dentium]|uniref:hypothetical protein n=1 Tax=Bifidobacterium dentium TaxID=1689 RepID=UPI001F50C046|nr:hypothetical protein [Bifidobacterium dentium]